MPLVLAVRLVACSSSTISSQLVSPVISGGGVLERNSEFLIVSFDFSICSLQNSVSGKKVLVERSISYIGEFSLTVDCASMCF